MKKLRSHLESNNLLRVALYVIPMIVIFIIALDHSPLWIFNLSIILAIIALAHEQKAR